MCGHCGCQSEKIIQVEQDILSENQRYADKNRAYFLSHHINAFNFVSSPGSGKTTLLVKTINQLKSQFNIRVIEGDQQSEHDKACIEKTGARVIQINTGKSCHLDAHAIGHAVEDLALGEKSKVAILSVTEGAEKPLKYPYMFAESSVMLINKIDLLPYVDFDLKLCIDYAKRVNPEIKVMQLSSKTGEGFGDWLAWLKAHAAIAA